MPSLSRADDEIDRDTAVVGSVEETPPAENVSVELPVSASAPGEVWQRSSAHPKLGK